MGSKKNVTTTVNEDVIKIVADTQVQPENGAEAGETAEVATAVAAKKQKSRSKRYQAVRAQVDRTKSYDPFAAIEMIKKLSYSSFTGTISIDAVVKEAGVQATISFPHSTGKTLKVAIVDAELISTLEKGVIEFDVLVTEPRFMPQLAKFAKVLGPKGLMPNPKNSTVTANPELKKTELEGGKVTLKTEKKAPLIHVSIGKTDMDTKALLENLEAFTAAFKGKLVKMSLTATMSPAVRVTIEA